MHHNMRVIKVFGFFFFNLVFYKSVSISADACLSSFLEMAKWLTEENLIPLKDL